MFHKKTWSLYIVAIVADAIDIIAAPILQLPVLGDIVDIAAILFFVNKNVDWYALIAVPEFVPVVESVPFHLAAILVWDFNKNKK